jgi:hypothetical protein
VGRHSAPDDDAPEAPDAGDEPGSGATAVAVVTAPGRHARHARPDDQQPPGPDGDTDDGLTAELLAEFGEQTAPVPTPATAAATERPAAGSRSDLRLLRRHGDVRARVIAGIVVPFAVFTVVMALLDRLDRSYFIWIWIPLVTAGVLGGLFLDLGHRRYSTDSDHGPQAAPQP